ncbi:MAG: cytidylate kinase [Steroidobacteraceae bacterium]|nr:cytidylate kinase [Steroidobacteraceae bacterium]MBM2854322.1 cytidylate kinase [Steroidobacteraceae bacterium]
MVPVIAIDGPGGSGKGTVARLVARHFGWHLLDSGALYRLVALAGFRNGLSADDVAGHARLAATLDVTFESDSQVEERVMLAGTDVTRELRGEQTGEAASRVAAWAEVRSALLGRQRAFARPPGLVADGRDMGSIVFRAAGLKVFLTASPEERARRRYKQLKQKGLGVNLAALSAEIAERDRRDTTRPVAPLIVVPDAIVVDSTTLSIEEVVERVIALAHERFPGLARQI